MSVLTVETPAAPVSGFGHRVATIVRLNTANPWTTIILPWIIVGIIFVVNWLIWWIIFTASGAQSVSAVASGIQYSGASLWIFFYMLVVAVQAINLTFPLALGYGATRRDFWVGTALTFVLLSLGYTVALSALSVVEELTGGWGLGGTMFTNIYFGESWYERVFSYFTLMMFFFFVGAAVATVYVRWKANGIVTFFAALAAILIVVVAAITFTESWPAVGAFLGRAGLMGVYAWSYVLTVIAAIVGYLVLRRATPRS